MTDGTFKASLHLPGSMPFVTVGDEVTCEWVDYDSGIARLMSEPATNLNYRLGDTVIVDTDDEGEWHVIAKEALA